MKKKRQTKKKITAFLLALLTLSGGAFALPIGKTSVDDLAYQNIKQLQDNPMQFLKMENLDMSDDFDYFKELNNEFVKDPEFKISEENLEKSFEKGDYEEWKSEFAEIGGRGIISKEEFEILRQIKSKENSYK